MEIAVIILKPDCTNMSYSDSMFMEKYSVYNN